MTCDTLLSSQGTDAHLNPAFQPNLGAWRNLLGLCCPVKSPVFRGHFGRTRGVGAAASSSTLPASRSKVAWWRSGCTGVRKCEAAQQFVSRPTWRPMPTRTACGTSYRQPRGSPARPCEVSRRCHASLNRPSRSTGRRAAVSAWPLVAEVARAPVDLPRARYSITTLHQWLALPFRRRPRPTARIL